METADYVIVGGGSAGCVLANRLSADPRNRVLLLEAGPPSDGVVFDAPVGFVKLTQDPRVNWMYATEPDPSSNGRRVRWDAGKALGGGSAINGMVYIRGARYDYDDWAAAGCTGWSWDEVLPYFIRSETFEDGATPVHGDSGPLGVSRLRMVHPLAHAFVAACEQVQIPQVEDYSAGDVDGVFINLTTQKDGRRSSTAASYLKAAKSRRNLKVVTGALVDRVTFTGNRASGVVYRVRGTEHAVSAAREVVVSAGTIQSPALLLRSGIGPGEHLKSMGIEVLNDLQGVGRNLQEHNTVNNARFANVQTYNTIRNPIRLALEGLNYLLLRRGVVSLCPVHAMASARSRPDLKYPDIKLQMLPLCFDHQKGGPHERPGICVTINNMYPKTRGEIRLRSVDPAEDPVIDIKMYEHDEDLAVSRAGLRLVDSIFAAPGIAPFLEGRIEPPFENATDEQLDDYIRATGTVAKHPVGTCSMGTSDSAVVDPQLRVRGVEGLRVVDASIMPLMPSGNTNVPSIMVGEKGADMILQAG